MNAIPNMIPPITRSTVKALDPFIEKRNHVAVWNWVQLFNPNKFYLKAHMTILKTVIILT